MPIPKTITSLLEKHKIKVLYIEGVLILRVQSGVMLKNPRYKNILYSILNRYARNFFIQVEGVPCCFLPKAVEHIAYPQGASGPFIKHPSCTGCRFYKQCPGLPASCTKSLPPVPNAPDEIAIEIISSCNLACDYCFHTNIGNATILSFSKIKKALDEASAMKIKTIRFTGGEPLLHPELSRILQYTKTRGFNTCLNTNATLINDKSLSFIEQYVDNILISICTVSSQGSKNKSSYWVSTKQKICALRKLIHSRTQIVRVGTVISTELIENFQRYASLVQASGARIWEFYRPMLRKDILATVPEYNIESRQLRKVLSLAGSLKSKNISAYLGNAVPFCIFKNKRLPFMVGGQFEDGNNRLVLDSKGYYKPSYCININLGSTIRQAWAHPFIKKVNSASSLSKTCKRCLYSLWCRGGSRFMADQAYGDYFAADPLQNKK